MDTAAGGKAANEAKRRVAREIVALYHGVEAATQAESKFNAMFRDHAIPLDAPEYRADLAGSVHLPAMIVAAGMAASSSDARRLIDASAVKIDGVTLPPKSYDVDGEKLRGRVLAVGKRKVVRLTSQ
jgi:tyrosyl-tRNA synthetase